MQSNLPDPLTPFIGRKREISEITRLIGAIRLVTVPGAGGAGKTRLAIEVTTHLQSRFVDGVSLIELAPLADPAMVIHTIASTLHIQTASSADLSTTLADFLAAKDMLLILDNCEHVVSASANLVLSLLRRPGKVRILATSREPLATPGEITCQVPPLSTPNAKSQLTLEELTNFESIQLFIERSHAVRHDFCLTQENTTCVAEICRRLDGLPLAIELAAARINVLSPSEKRAKVGRSDIRDARLPTTLRS